MGEQIRTPQTRADIEALFPDAAIEEVGDRRELVIYTGLSTKVLDPNSELWIETPNATLVPMNEFAD